LRYRFTNFYFSYVTNSYKFKQIHQCPLLNNDIGSSDV